MSCDFSTVNLDTYKNTIQEIYETVKTSDSIDSGVITSAISELDVQNGEITKIREIIKDCISNFKIKRNQPEANYDNKNTSYLMLQNSQSLYQEIIYTRIQLIIYIVGLLYFFYTKLI